MGPIEHLNDVSPLTNPYLWFFRDQKFDSRFNKTVAAHISRCLFFFSPKVGGNCGRTEPNFGEKCVCVPPKPKIIKQRVSVRVHS